MAETNLLDFIRMYEKVVVQFRKLSQFSASNYTNNYDDLMEYLNNPYINQFCKESIDAMEEYEKGESDEITEDPIHVPQNKVLRLTYVLVTMKKISENGQASIFKMVLQFGENNFARAYSTWYDKIAQDIITDLIEDIHFEIRRLEERKENQNKELEEILVPTTNYHIHGTTYNSQFGNYNTQNITIDNLFSELVNSDIKFSEDNRELIQNEVKNIEEEVSKHNPSKDKIKGMLERIYVKGETEVIKYLGTKLNHIPAVTSAIMEFL